MAKHHLGATVGASTRKGRCYFLHTPANTLCGQCVGEGATWYEAWQAAMALKQAGGFLTTEQALALTQPTR